MTRAMIVFVVVALLLGIRHADAAPSHEEATRTDPLVALLMLRADFHPGTG